MLTKTIKQSLKFLPPFKKVVIGVSGGADSVALAHILIELGYRVTIAHLNHGLRGKESDTDERFVTKLADQWKVPCVTHKIRLKDKGNTENNARLIRYAFLEKVRTEKKATFIAVGHHQDDQIETVLMHIQRGAGLRGLCGMRLQNGAVIRPLLGVTKKDLVTYLKKKNIDFRTDISNFDTRFRRNLLRHRIIPELKKKHKGFEDQLLTMSATAQTQLQIIEKRATEWIRSQVADSGFGRLEFLKLPDSLQSEVLFQIIGYRDLYRRPIGTVKTLIKKGVTGKQKQAGALTFRMQYDRVVFYKGFKVTRSPKRVKLTMKEVRWGPWALQYTGKQTLFARAWQPGDRFKPAGLKGSKKLQDFFVDQKIPKSQRHHIPVIVDKQDQILSVADFRIAENAAHLKQCLRINKIK